MGCEFQVGDYVRCARHFKKEFVGRTGHIVQIRRGISDPSKYMCIIKLDKGGYASHWSYRLDLIEDQSHGVPIAEVDLMEVLE